MFVWVGGQPRFLAFVLIFIPPVVESAKQKVCLMRLHNLRVAHTIFFAFFFFFFFFFWVGVVGMMASAFAVYTSAV